MQVPQISPIDRAIYHCCLLRYAKDLIGKAGLTEDECTSLRSVIDLMQAARYALHDTAAAGYGSYVTSSSAAERDVLMHALRMTLPDLDDSHRIGVLRDAQGTLERLVANDLVSHEQMTLARGLLTTYQSNLASKVRSYGECTCVMQPVDAQQ